MNDSAECEAYWAINRNCELLNKHVGSRWELFGGGGVNVEGGGHSQGGYLVWKKVPTAVRPLRSCGFSELTWTKNGGCQVIIYPSIGGS